MFRAACSAERRQSGTNDHSFGLAAMYYHVMQIDYTVSLVRRVVGTGGGDMSMCFQPTPRASNGSNRFIIIVMSISIHQHTGPSQIPCPWRLRMTFYNQSQQLSTQGPPTT